MKVKSIGFWVATTLIASETFVGGVTDLVHGRTVLVAGPSVVGVVTHLGYPVYILTILASGRPWAPSSSSSRVCRG